MFWRPAPRVILPPSNETIYITHPRCIIFGENLSNVLVVLVSLSWEGTGVRKFEAAVRVMAHLIVLYKRPDYILEEVDILHILVLAKVRCPLRNAGAWNAPLLSSPHPTD